MNPLRRARFDVPEDFIPLIDDAKKEYKNLTGKKNVSNKDAFKFINSSHKFWKGKDLFENRRGVVGDTIIASAALIVIVLVVALVSLILFNFNNEIQSLTDIPEEAKDAAEFSEIRFTNILGYSFLFAFVGFFLYTIITSIIINNIHPIFWVIGLVFLIVSTMITSVFKLIYGQIESFNIIEPFITSIPGAGWYFNNIEIINVLWIILQLTIVYLRRDA